MGIHKKSSVFITIIMIMVVFSAHISHSINVERCIKDCIPNQCMKVIENPDLTICKEACEKFCNRQPNVQMIVPPEGDGGIFGRMKCLYLKNCP